MSDNWIENKMRELVQGAQTEEQNAFIRRLADEDGPNAIEITERGGKIELDDVNAENIRKELFAYQDGRKTGELASSGLRSGGLDEPTLDSVEVVKTGEVFRGLS